jgi:threonyl-tRNA synthetase
VLDLPAPRLRLSLRGEGDKYVADDDLWARSEAVLRAVLDRLGLAYDEGPGEAAFYGPKIDLQVTDPQGRQETLSTVQVDFLLPERFGLSVRVGDEDVRPVMIHRSIVSTMERMVAHLLEVHAGALPVWLSPTQVRILPVVDDAADHAGRVLDVLRRRGVRARIDDRDATLGARVRAAQQDKVPYVAVVGRHEARDDTVAVRRRDGRRLDAVSPEVFADLVGSMIDERSPGLEPVA